MSFFPSDFDPRADVVGYFELVNINTTDGDFGFLLGVDGVFTDLNGKNWYGSQLITGSDTEMAINGVAPSGELTLSFFQDPIGVDLISEVKRLGLTYIEGRALTFFVQVFTAHEQMTSPTIAPIQVARRTMRGLGFSANEALDRSITVSFEGPFEQRRSARRMVYNVEDHERLIGSSNPSLTYIPQTNQQDEKIYG